MRTVFSERDARIALAGAARPGDPATSRLIDAYGAVETITLARVGKCPPLLTDVRFATWRGQIMPALTPDECERRARLTDQQELGTLTPDDPAWAHTCLAALGEDAPLALWTRGRAELLAEDSGPRLTITGARAPSRYGGEITRDFTYDLAEQGIIIVSGAGYGIDGIAHHAALTIDRDTIGILAGSIDRPYPAGATSQIRRIGDDGLLITEAPPGAPPPTVQSVQHRARLLAALSTATLIVEATARCDSLVVADHAFALGRPVAAIPGPITSGVSGGCHLLIADGRAQLVSTPGEVAQLCAGANTRPPTPRPAALGEPAVLAQEPAPPERITVAERIAS